MTHNKVPISVRLDPETVKFLDHVPEGQRSAVIQRAVTRAINRMEYYREGKTSVEYKDDGVILYHRPRWAKVVEWYLAD